MYRLDGTLCHLNLMLGGIDNSRMYILLVLDWLTLQRRLLGTHYILWTS